MPFKESQEGQTHFQNDHCGELAHNNLEEHRLSRVEVIDETGRVYVRYCEPGDVQVSLQDGERTMKIFIFSQKQE